MAAPVPALDGLRITVSPPRPVTEEAVSERFLAVLRVAAKVEPRAKGALIEAHDEVRVDVLTYANGSLLPFGSMEGLLLTADEGCAIPELGTRLVGLPVGGSAQISARFPADYQVPTLAGQTAVFLVDLKSASQVSLPDFNDEATLASLNLGATLDDVMDALTADLTKEADADYLARRRLAVARELVRRTPFPLDAALIEHELGRRWLAQEGRFLARRRLSEVELETSFRGWRDDGITWATVEADVRGALLVRALLENGKLALTPEDLVDDLLQLSLEMGATSTAEAAARLQKEDLQTSVLLNAAVMNSALEKLASASTISAA